jgi:hypothetical protein
MAGTPPLKVRFEDAEDLAVLSAALQDAVLRVGDMAYIEAERRFVCVAMRFRWERLDAAAERAYERVHTGITFENVTAVRRRGVDPARPGQMLALLAIRVAGAAVDLICAGGAAIRLETGGIAGHAQDLDEPWPTRWRPNHPVPDET